MDRTDYPGMLGALTPGQAVDVLNDRVRQVGKLNTDIADWLQERRRLEELYSNGLQKLARRQLDGADLGVFSVPWNAMIGATETLADSHSALAQKIEVDVEQPLRQFASTNREMQAMSNMQGNLAAMAKDVESGQKKTEKLKSKGDKTGVAKVASASNELDNAQGQWDSQAPYVFESLQAADESRLNHLRDVLTQLQTHEVDQVEKNRVTAEKCLNVLLNVETADEIKTFALRAVQGKPKMEKQRRSVALPSRPTTSKPSATALSPLVPSISQSDDGRSQRSGSVNEQPKKANGLNRLGTVFGRRRESKQPLPSMAESPDRKSRRSGLNTFSNRLGRNKESLPSLDTPREESTRQRRPRSPLHMGSEVLEAPQEELEPVSPRPFSAVVPRAERHINGMSSAGTPRAAVEPASAMLDPAASNVTNGSHQNDLTGLEPPLSAPSEPTMAVTALESQRDSQRDSEGFTIPPQNLDTISQAQRDAGEANENAPSQLNVNIRNASIREEGLNDDAALASMATKLPPVPTSRKLGTVRGRREARNSMFMPPPQTVPGPIAEESVAGPASAVVQAPIDPIAATEVSRGPPVDTDAGVASSQPVLAVAQPTSTSIFLMPGHVAASTFSPFSAAEQLRPSSRAAQPDSDHPLTDNQSTRSGRSLTSTGSQGMKHPELHGTGLSSSIVETVSATFENGRPIRSTLIGEIAMAYNPADFSTPFGTETIRLENFPSLEKVAPNPTFISPAAKEGEYTVNLSSITKTAVAFKYQVGLEDASPQAPLVVQPAFKVEPTQTSVIVTYSLNPTFAMHGKSSITISNIMLGLTLEGAKATSCQSKPVGTFSGEKNLIFWKLGDVTLESGAAPQKLLARFSTESEAKSGTVEARWEITGEHVQGLGSGLTVSMLEQKSGATDGVDPFADDEVSSSGLMAIWKGVQGPKKLVSGKYSAK